MFDFCGILITFEIGKVTNFSISSALRPGHWVIIRALVFVTSGKRFNWRLTSELAYKFPYNE